MADPTTLALAAFMDSKQALMLPAPSTDEIRSVAERFLRSCFEDLGRPPEELDGEALREMLAVALPTRFSQDDPLVSHTEPVVTAYLEHLEETSVLSHAFELKLATADGFQAFERACATRGGPRRRSKSEAQPFVYGAGKTGRNDKCPCGSGKKFKHCHGK